MRNNEMKNRADVKQSSSGEERIQLAGGKELKYCILL